MSKLRDGVSRDKDDRRSAVAALMRGFSRRISATKACVSCVASSNSTRGDDDSRGFCRTATQEGISDHDPGDRDPTTVLESFVDPSTLLLLIPLGLILIE